MDYLKRIEKRLSGLEVGVPGELGDKRILPAFAKSIGVKTSNIFYVGEFAGLDFDKLPDAFVIKPSYASTSVGVFLLRKESEDSFYDLVADKSITKEFLEDQYSELSEKYYKDPSVGMVQVEELLTSPDGSFPPPDIRAYMFQGECGVIIVEDHIAGPARATYFNGDFSKMLDVAHRYSVAKGAEQLESIVDREPPSNADVILNVVKRISVAIPSAFCRVDVYNTQKGVILGEVTFYPGTFYYKNRKVMSQPEAERLGKLWAQAEARLVGSVLKPARKSGN